MLSLPRTERLSLLDKFRRIKPRIRSLRNSRRCKMIRSVNSGNAVASQVLMRLYSPFVKLNNGVKPFPYCRHIASEIIRPRYPTSSIMLLKVGDAVVLVVNDGIDSPMDFWA